MKDLRTYLVEAAEEHHDSDCPMDWTIPKVFAALVAMLDWADQMRAEDPMGVGAFMATELENRMTAVFDSVDEPKDTMGAVCSMLGQVDPRDAGRLVACMSAASSVENCANCANCGHVASYHDMRCYAVDLATDEECPCCAYTPAP